jgi:hypothetical protein
VLGEASGAASVVSGSSDVAEAAGAAATLHKRDFVPSTLEALWLKHMPDG